MEKTVSVSCRSAEPGASFLPTASCCSKLSTFETNSRVRFATRPFHPTPKNRANASLTASPIGIPTVPSLAVGTQELCTRGAQGMFTGCTSEKPLCIQCAPLVYTDCVKTHFQTTKCAHPLYQDTPYVKCARKENCQASCWEFSHSLIQPGGLPRLGPQRCLGWGRWISVFHGKVLAQQRLAPALPSNPI
jgi:hypothetical protein